MNRKLCSMGIACLCCVSVAVAADVRREIQFPDLPDLKTLKCDFHMHTVFSDGSVWPPVRVDEAWRQGLDAIAITDHIEVQPHKQDVPTNHNRSHALAVGAAQRKNVLLIRGTEITRDTPPGHFNAVFLKDIDPLDTEDFYAVFEAAAAQKAFVFWNHPAWQGAERGKWGEAQTKLLERKQMHGIEVCNNRTYYADAHRYAIERNLVLIGNTDVHAPLIDNDWTAEEHRTLTLVFAQERSIAAIREALFAGRTAIWYQNQLIGRKEHLAPLFDRCIRIGVPHHRGGNDAWVEIRNLCELDIELERVGQRGPAKISLPARVTSLFKFPASGPDEKDPLRYRMKNCLIAPGEYLVADLAVPKE